ncbi:hypothetical protein ARMSODRAFT_1021792 [Armillaria solidipes]|uniref:Uncharacterized protein n=1 Tax=Armillaria solidipes TaxID=1076256 RepID=A0A2H3BGN9_9AGAR|nr:hypothetical protein ARMSODRAFT_1021792 [Armillaria solidipes]
MKTTSTTSSTTPSTTKEDRMPPSPSHLAQTDPTPPSQITPSPSNTTKTTVLPEPPIAAPHPTSWTDIEASKILSISMDPTMSGIHSAPSIEGSSGLIALQPGSYGAEMLRQDTICSGGLDQQWEDTWQRTEETPYPGNAERLPSWQGSLPIETDSYTLLHQDGYYEDHAGSEPTRRPRPSREPYSSWPLDSNEWNPRPASSNQFDTFHYDYGTFRYQNDPYPQARYNFPPYPFPLPDEPLQPPHPRRVQKYRPPQYGTHPFVGQNSPINDEQPDQGGSNQPPEPTKEERLTAAKERSEEKQRAAEDLRRRYEATLEASKGHDMIWNFDRPDNKGKGKDPDRGRPPVPEWHKPLYAQRD